MQQIKRKACQKSETLSKTTFLAMLTEGSKTKVLFENLPDNEWSIASFDSLSKEVCLKIYQKGQTKTLSVNLPYIV